MKHNFCMHCMSVCNADVCNICGKSIKEYQVVPHHLQPGTVLGGKYVVGSVLGEGGFGITYIGRDINLDIKVAIKEYFPYGVVNRNNTSSTQITAQVGKAQDFFEKGKSSFLAEARTLAKFSDESSIVSVRDFFSENNTVYIVMEYLEGIDLKDYIKQHGKMSFEQTVTMLTPVMQALSKIHSQGLIHRDISPANIMILKDGTVKLLDFGAAREVGGADEKSLSILLKPGFAPEEQYRTKGHQGSWTDVYALSATMYKMMTGETPIDAMNRVFSDDLSKISDLNPSVTQAQESVIFKGMAVQQVDRYQTVDQLCADCQTVMQQGGLAKEPVNNKKTIKGDKKPSVAAFIGSIISGIIALYFVLNSVALIIDEDNPLLSIVVAILGGAGAVLLSRLYFPRIDNKNRKPNVFCLVCSIFTSLITIVCAFATYSAFADVWSQESEGAFNAALTVVSLALPIFFGYFYYPRLDRNKKRLYTKIYTGGLAAVVTIFVGVIVFTSLNTVTIGDNNIERNATSVNLSFDIITDSDLQKLKELKKLETLEITECFLDDADVKTIGELTQIKRLSLSGNTDITDVSPLNNLKDLTYLNISLTKTTDISCLDELVSLETLNVSDTSVQDLSVVSNYSQLDTLNIDSVDGLDFSTITLPETVQTLYCCSNDLDNLDFVSGSTQLANIYAANNSISDLTPLSGYQLNIVDLSANKISDLSALAVEHLSDLDVSTNNISDISCLEGITTFELDLGYNQISDISVLKDNYKLGIVDLNNNQITNIDALKDCFNIFSLDISYNRISDISAVATIDDMEIFNARSNQIADISPLTSCEKLIEAGNALDLRDNRIKSVDALSGYINTSSFYFSGNNITDISPLASCLSLETLRINNNAVTDVSSLGTLSKLRRLEVVNNPITDIDGLNLTAAGDGLLEKAVLHISYHKNIDFVSLAGIENLSVIIYDVPPREREKLYELGFTSFGSIEELDKKESNADLAEGATESEDIHG